MWPLACWTAAAKSASSVFEASASAPSWTGSPGSGWRWASSSSISTSRACASAKWAWSAASPSPGSTKAVAMSTSWVADVVEGGDAVVERPHGVRQAERVGRGLGQAFQQAHAVVAQGRPTAPPVRRGRPGTAISLVSASSCPSTSNTLASCSSNGAAPSPPGRGRLPDDSERASWTRTQPPGRLHDAVGPAAEKRVPGELLPAFDALQQKRIVAIGAEREQRRDGREQIRGAAHGHRHGEPDRAVLAARIADEGGESGRTSSGREHNKKARSTEAAGFGRGGRRQAPGRSKAAAWSGDHQCQPCRGSAERVMGGNYAGPLAGATRSGRGLCIRTLAASASPLPPPWRCCTCPSPACCPLPVSF